MIGELCEGAKEEDFTARENAAARDDHRRESQWRWEEKGLGIEWVVKVWKTEKAEKRRDRGVKKMNKDRRRTGE